MGDRTSRRQVSGIEKGKRFRADRQLIAILSLFLLAGIILLSIMTLSTNTISALRSYSSLQVHWTEVRKEAVGKLENYALTGQPQFLGQYFDAVDVLDEAGLIRDELTRDHTDTDRIIRLAAPFRFRDDELKSMVTIYKRFGSLPIFTVAVTNWENSDRQIDRLDSLAYRIQEALSEDVDPIAAGPAWLSEIEAIDNRLSELKFDLASNLDLGTRQLRSIVFWSAVVTGGLFLLIGGLMAKRYTRERHEAREKIQGQLDEKTTLLVEIHHRVKNNLALISGMLMLQEETAEDENLRYQLRESQNRIASIADVHEIMYRANNFSELSIGRYAESIIRRICRSFSTVENRIKSSVSGEEVFLGMNEAIPIGLIVNELATNSCKHAFYQQEQRSICLHIEKRDRRVTVIYTDNGNGLPADFNLEDASRQSLGMQLITSLLGQLDAEFKLGKGAEEFRMEITFRTEKEWGDENQITAMAPTLFF